MTDNVKSGSEIVASFFAEIELLEGVDKNVALALKRLYADGKLTNINISNTLAQIRKEAQDENKKH